MRTLADPINSIAFRGTCGLKAKPVVLSDERIAIGSSRAGCTVVNRDVNLNDAANAASADHEDQPSARRWKRSLSTVMGGLLLAAVDVRIDGFDVASDVVGYALVATGARSLSTWSRLFGATQGAASLLVILAAAGQLRTLRGQGSDWVIATAADDRIQLTLPYLQGTIRSPLWAITLATGLAVGVMLWSLLYALGTLRQAEVNDGSGETRQNVGLAMFAGAIYWFAGNVLIVGGSYSNGQLFTFLAPLVLGGAAVLLYLNTARRERPPAPLDGDGAKLPWATASGAFVGVLVVAASTTVGPPPNYRPLPEVEAVAESSGYEGRTTPDRIIFDPAPFEREFDEEMCSERVVSLSAVDLLTGEQLWQHDAHRQPSAPLLVVDGNVIITDPSIGSTLPSVSALNPRTGEVAWQHFFTSHDVRIVGAADDQVLVESGIIVDYRAITDLVVLDADGERPHRVVYDEHLAGIARQPTMRRPFYDAINDWNDYFYTLRFASTIDSAGRQVIARTSGDGPTYSLRDVATGLLVPSSKQTVSGEGSSSGPSLYEVEHDDDLTLLVTRQGVRPEPSDREAHVANGSTNEPLWTLEHLQSASLASGYIVYSTKSERPITDEDPYDLLVVDGRDPDNVIGSTSLSLNRAGRDGFLGSTGTDLVFLVAGPDGDLGPAELLLIAISPDQKLLDMPDTISAGGALGDGPGRLSHVSDSLIVAADQGSLLWRRSDGQTGRVQVGDVGAEIVSLTVVGDTAVVEQVGLSACAELGLPVYRHPQDETTGIRPGDDPVFNVDLARVGRCSPADSTIAAVNLETGEELWSHTVPQQPEHSPVVVNDSTLVVSDTRSENVYPSLAAFDAETGRLRWQRHLMALRFSVEAVDEATGNVLIVVDYDRGHFDEWRLQAIVLDVDTGDVVSGFDPDEDSLSTIGELSGYRVLPSARWLHDPSRGDQGGPNVIDPEDERELRRSGDVLVYEPLGQDPIRFTTSSRASIVGWAVIHDTIFVEQSAGRSHC